MRQCRLRGRIDSQGVVAAFLEERVNVGVNFLLSAEVTPNPLHFRLGVESQKSLHASTCDLMLCFRPRVSKLLYLVYNTCADLPLLGFHPPVPLLQIDHSKKDYKFGFGMTIGE